MPGSGRPDSSPGPLLPFYQASSPFPPTPDLGVGPRCQYTREIYWSSRLWNSPGLRTIDWVFPSPACSPYHPSRFSIPRDICHRTQLVTPKSMRRMAVPAKAATALRMLVPRLLLTCGRDRHQEEAKRRKDQRRPLTVPSLPHPPSRGPGVGAMSPARSWVFFSHSSFSSLSLGPQEEAPMPPFASSSSWELLGRRLDPLRGFPGPGLQQVPPPALPFPQARPTH